MQTLKRNWFTCLIIAVAVLGILLPGAAGTFKGYIRYHVVTAMFFATVTIPLRRMLGRMLSPTAAGLVLAHNFLLMPALCFAAGALFFRQYQGAPEGLLVIGAVACTISSSVVWTQIAKGDDALAFSMVMYSSLTSVLLTPLILKVTLGRVMDIDTGRMICDLAFFILLPVVAAQLLRAVPGAAARFDAWKKPVSVLCRFLVAFIIFFGVAKAAGQVLHQAGLAESRAEQSAPFWTVIWKTSAASAAIHAVLLAASYWIARLLRRGRAEAIAIMFCSSQKSLIIATPLVLGYFHGAGYPYAFLPALLYHGIQLVMDSMLLGRLSERKPDATG